VFLGAVSIAPQAAARHVSFGQPQAAHVGHGQPGHLIASVRPGRSVALRDRPFGRIIARVGPTTPFGSRRTLGVITTHHGRWLGVTDPASGRDRLVWADARRASLRYSRTRLELKIDLSSRTLNVLRGRAVLRHLSIGVGRLGSPTPPGRFAVTDKLDGRAYGASYGCCILALSAVQPTLPAGWRGGNRIAIHGTRDSGDLGAAVSAGCLHASDHDLRFLMRRIALGTPVVIRP
jgi:hypothetical protein